MDTVDELLRQRGLLEAQVAAERGIRLSLEQRCASQATTIDWLSAELTQARMERAALVERAFQVTLPVPMIGREAPPETPRIDPATIRAFASSIEVPKNVPRDGDSPVAALAAFAGVSFDDPGDEEAARMGLKHTDIGEVVSK